MLSGSARMLLGCALFVTVACTDSTAPGADPVVTPPVERDVPNPALVALGAWLPSATSWVIDNMDDKDLQAKLRPLLSDLAQQLTASNTKGIQNSIASIRSLLSGASSDEVIELGPIDVTLSTIEDAMAGIK